MERRYDIAGKEGLGNAKELMNRRMNAGGDGLDIAEDLQELADFRRNAAASAATTKALNDFGFVGRNGASVTNSI